MELVISDLGFFRQKWQKCGGTASKSAYASYLVLVWTRTPIKGPQRGRHFFVPHTLTRSSLATTMGKHQGPIPCTLCDRRFTSLPNLRQASSCFPTFPGKFTDFSHQHLRDKHNINTPTQAPAAEAQPPAQEPQVQVEDKPSHTVRTSLFDGQQPSAKARVSPPLSPWIRQYANIASPISLP